MKVLKMIFPFQMGDPPKSFSWIIISLSDYTNITPVILHITQIILFHLRTSKLLRVLFNS